MKLAKTTLVVFLCTAIFSTIAFSEELSNQKKEAIKELIEVTGALNIGKQFSQVVVAQMTMMLKISKSDVPEKAFDILKDVVNSTIDEEINSFVELCYPVYHKHLTLDEISKMVEFYKTPTGKKVVKVMPEMMQESMLVGQQWAQSIGNKFEERLTSQLKKEGIEIKK